MEMITTKFFENHSPLSKPLAKCKNASCQYVTADDVYRHHAEIHDADGEQEILKGSSDGLIPPPPGVELHDESEIDLEKDLKVSHLTSSPTNSI